MFVPAGSLTLTPAKSLSLVDLPLSSPTLILVEQAELDALVNFGKKCQGALVSCTSRVSLLEAYAAESDKQLKDVSQSLVEEQAKPKLNYLYLVPPFVLGLVLGFAVTR